MMRTRVRALAGLAAALAVGVGAAACGDDGEGAGSAAFVDREAVVQKLLKNSDDITPAGAECAADVFIEYSHPDVLNELAHNDSVAIPEEKLVKDPDDLDKMTSELAECYYQ